MYLTDTNHCSYIIQGHPLVMQAILSRRKAGIAISVVIQGELLYMAERSSAKADNLTRIQQFLSRFECYPITAEISCTYAALKATLLNTFGPQDPAKRRGVKIQSIGFDDNDLWIAATALQYQLILVSADRDFTRIQQVTSLQVESWTA
jgi:tRNA(fMet)-specific endonuclease VapC